MRRSVALLLGLLGLLGPLAGCGGGSTASVKGTELAPNLDGRKVEVTLPVGKLEVTLGHPTDHLSAGSNDADDEKDHHVPHGWTYVPVGALLDPNAVDTATLQASGIQPARLALTVGGRTYAVPAPYTVSASGAIEQNGQATYVPVKGDGKDVGVAVTYDGVTQTVSSSGKRTEGAAAPYYDGSAGKGSTVSVDGRWHSPKNTTVEMGGTVQILTTPYLASYGWAKAGDTFIAFDISIGVNHAHRGTGVDELTSLTLSARLDDTPQLPHPPGSGSVQSSAGMAVGRIYFEVPAAQMHTLDLQAKVLDPAALKGKGPGIVATHSIVWK